ncbi:MAG TPA: PAS domain S-box protein [Candidatus Methanoperedens sp.]|nr:PAS domain S-box protein [Candidatus Methanoperedens sp.]
MKKESVTNINHILKILLIVITIFFIGYFLESLRGISSMIGDYFLISTEILPLVLSFAIFIVTWYSYDKSKDNHWIFLGLACLVIGLIDLFHLLSYPFMPDFISANSTQKTTVFWGEARLVSALLFLASVYVTKNNFPDVINKTALFLSAIIISSIFFVIPLLFPDNLPAMYRADGYPSGASIILVAVTILITLYAGSIYVDRTRQKDTEIIVFLKYGLITMVVSYPVYFFYGYSEHLLRAAGFYFLYLAIYKSSIEQPYEKLALADEKLLQETREKYDNLFNNPHDAIITCHPDEIIVSWNKSAEKMFGWIADEAIGKGLPELIMLPENRDKIDRKINEVVSGRVVTGIDSTYIRKDGTKLDVNITISPIQGIDTKTIVLSYIIRDVTERKNAENTLQASEKKYSTLVEKGNDGIVIIQDGNLKFVNSKIVQITGFTIEEGLGKPFVDFISEKFKETVIEIYRQRISGEVPKKNYEIEIISKTGKNIPVEINASLIEYEGRPAVMAILRDITERRQAQEALSWEIEENVAISELSSTLLSQATIEDISVLVLGHAKRITGSNYGYAGYIDTKTGYLVCPSMSHDTMDVCKMKDSNNILKEFNGLFGWVLKNEKPLLTNSPSSDPRSSGTPNGHIPIFRFISAPAVLKENLIGQISAGNPIGNKIHSIRYYDKGKLVGQVALANSDRDYTDRDLAFVERLTDIYAIAINRYLAQEKIKKSLKEKEVLLREIHHRVKNNMQIISSLLSLQSNSMPEEKYKGIFKESQNRIISMALIHEKLYHSRDIEKIDFKEYIEDLAKSLFQSYEVYGNIELRIDVKDVFLGIDFAIPCGLILNELVTNSIKYGFPDGRKGMISIFIKSNETGYVELEVNDNGVGIPEGFDISKTSSLGLHLVTILSEQLNGEISWDGNDGTKFKIKFKEVIK